MYFLLPQASRVDSLTTLVFLQVPMALSCVLCTLWVAVQLQQDLLAGEGGGWTRHKVGTGRTCNRQFISSLHVPQEQGRKKNLLSEEPTPTYQQEHEILVESTIRSL